MRARIELDGQAHDVALRRDGGAWTVEVDGEPFAVGAAGGGEGEDGKLRVGGREVAVALEEGRALLDGAWRPFRVLDLQAEEKAGGDGAARTARIRPPMGGRLERLLVRPGQAVAKGDVLFVLEAMKMHNEVRSPVAGAVGAVLARPGETLETDRVVLEIGPA